MPSLCVAEFHVRPFGRIYQNAAVKIEQRRIARDQDFQMLPVLEVGPGRSVCQRVRRDLPKLEDWRRELPGFNS